MSEWISVKDRLPKKKHREQARECVIVALESGIVVPVYYEFDYEPDNGAKRLFPEGFRETPTPVTHWMPLPEPPKED